MIYIFGIQIRKSLKTKPRNIVLKESGITSTKRTPKIIASLTTFPERINTVEKTIKTILNQTLKPDEVVLWLAESQFPKLEEELQWIKNIVFAWIPTNLCVRMFAEEAYDREYNLALIEDICETYNDKLQDFTLDDLNESRPDLDIVRLEQFLG